MGGRFVGRPEPRAHSVASRGLRAREMYLSDRVLLATTPHRRRRLGAIPYTSNGSSDCDAGIPTPIEHLSDQMSHRSRWQFSKCCSISGDRKSTARQTYWDDAARVQRKRSSLSSNASMDVIVPCARDCPASNLPRSPNDLSIYLNRFGTQRAANSFRQRNLPAGCNTSIETEGDSTKRREI